jgi:Tol biopolymer transport system component
MRPRSLVTTGLLATIAIAGCERPAPLANNLPLADRQTSVRAWADAENLGATINSPADEQSPTLSADGLTLYFVSNRPGGFGGSDLWISQRASHDAAWEPPVNLGSVVNSSGIESGPNLSLDGHLLFFQSNRPGGQGSNDIYVSHRGNTNDDFAWQPPINLGPDVNTAAADVGPTYLEHGDDGPILFFARGPSNLLTDIYAAPVTRDGQTRGPAALVSELSTPEFTEGRTSVRPNGRELVFFSNRGGGSGGADLWFTTRQTAHDAWSIPVNIGSPPNSPANDLLPFLTRDGRTLLYTSDRSDGFGAFDIWISSRVKSSH